MYHLPEAGLTSLLQSWSLVKLAMPKFCMPLCPVGAMLKLAWSNITLWQPSVPKALQNIPSLISLVAHPHQATTQ